MSNRTFKGTPGGSSGYCNIESKMLLRDTVDQLRQELLHSRAETQRVSEKLSCMMLLVKRAWQGDQKSAVDVANIIGVAPPAFEEKPGTFSVVTVTPKPVTDGVGSVLLHTKSRAVNNWAVLTIGILNREYKCQEEQDVARQQYYLHSRQAYLDEQLDFHQQLQNRIKAQLAQEAQQALMEKNRQIKQKLLTRPHNLYSMIERHQQTQAAATPTSTLTATPTSTLTATPTATPMQSPHSQTPVQRSSSFSGGEGHARRIQSASAAERAVRQAKRTQESERIQRARPQSSKPTSTARRQLYRSNSATSRPAAASQQLCWGDLVIDQTVNRHDVHQENNQSVYKLDKPTANGAGDVPRARINYRHRLAYDDPRRYNTSGLFDVESSVARAERQKAVSAQAQRDADNARARPRSAVYAKGERQIKYEVVRPTRPQSSHPRTGNNRTQPSTTINPTPVRRPPSGKKLNSSSKPARTIHVIPDMTSLEAAEDDCGGSDDGGVAADTDRSSVLAESERANRVAFDPEAFRKLGIDLDELERVERAPPPMKIDITQPQSVLDYERDVTDMHSMEQEITHNALALQKRLGLNENGILF